MTRLNNERSLKNVACFYIWRFINTLFKHKIMYVPLTSLLNKRRPLFSIMFLELVEAPMKATCDGQVNFYGVESKTFIQITLKVTMRLWRNVSRNYTYYSNNENIYNMEEDRESKVIFFSEHRCHSNVSVPDVNHFLKTAPLKL